LGIPFNSAEAFPLKTQEAQEIADILYSEMFTRYGACRTLVSDRGQNFLSKIVYGCKGALRAWVFLLTL
jgi:hypothetical protein